MRGVVWWGSLVVPIEGDYSPAVVDFVRPDRTSHVGLRSILTVPYRANGINLAPVPGVSEAQAGVAVPECKPVPAGVGARTAVRANLNWARGVA